MRAPVEVVDDLLVAIDPLAARAADVARRGLHRTVRLLRVQLLGCELARASGGRPRLHRAPVVRVQHEGLDRLDHLVQLLKVEVRRTVVEFRDPAYRQNDERRPSRLRRGGCYAQRIDGRIGLFNFDILHSNITSSEPWFEAVDSAEG